MTIKLDIDPERLVRTVDRVASAHLPTQFGPFRITGYKSLVGYDEFVALWTGELRHDFPTLIRIHSQCLTSEVFGSTRCDCALQLNASMELIAHARVGAVIYQFQEGRGIGILNKIKAYALQDQGADTVQANQELGFPADLRSFGQCAEILLDLNVRRVRIISNNPEKILALEQAGIEIVERVSPDIEMSIAAARYLCTKRDKMGHILNDLPCLASPLSSIGKESLE
jgi:3,4-dihydroxy 2-butanone 4-phosphate synthase/GTP cyclohydrolase II